MSYNVKIIRPTYWDVRSPVLCIKRPHVGDQKQYYMLGIRTTTCWGSEEPHVGIYPQITHATQHWASVMLNGKLSMFV